MRKILITVLIVVCIVGMLNAQQSAEELSKQAANPVADLMSFPFQNNLNMNQGPFDRNTNILNIQPVIPLLGGKVITRTSYADCQYPRLW